MERPAIKRLLLDIDRRLIDTVVVYKVDRLTRSLSDFSKIVEGLCHRHTGRLLPLAYLAPDLATLILEGRQPRAMTLQALTAKPLPRAWIDQRQLVASFR
jgi:DNA invertase Pin-like site-specific DNA recombinase